MAVLTFSLSPASNQHPALLNVFCRHHSSMAALTAVAASAAESVTPLTAESVSALTAINVSARLKQFNDLSRDSTTEDVVGFVQELLRESRPLQNDQEDTRKQRACIAADLVVSLFHLRAVRGWGRGIKHLFFVAFLELCAEFPSTGNALVRLIPRYGCWKDLLEICCLSNVPSIVENTCLEVFANQLRKDETAIADGGVLSFAAKWAPTEKKYYDKQKRLVDRICIFLYHPEHSLEALQGDDPLRYGMRKTYRKLLSKLKSELAASNVSERAQKWSSKVSEKTLPPAQLNLAELHPYTIFRKTIDAYYFDEVRLALHDSQEGIFEYFSLGDVYNSFRAELPSGTLQLIDVARVPLVRETLSSFLFGLDHIFEERKTAVSHVTPYFHRLGLHGRDRQLSSFHFKCPCAGRHSGEMCHGKSKCGNSCMLPGHHSPGSWVEDLSRPADPQFGTGGDVVEQCSLRPGLGSNELRSGKCAAQFLEPSGTLMRIVPEGPQGSWCTLTSFLSTFNDMHSSFQSMFFAKFRALIEEKDDETYVRRMIAYVQEIESAFMFVRVERPAGSRRFVLAYMKCDQVFSFKRRYDEMQLRLNRVPRFESLFLAFNRMPRPLLEWVELAENKAHLVSMESPLNKLVIFTREGNPTLGVMSHKKMSSDESQRIVTKLYHQIFMEIHRNDSLEAVERSGWLQPSQIEVINVFGKYAVRNAGSWEDQFIAQIFCRACLRNDIKSVQILLKICDVNNLQAFLLSEAFIREADVSLVKALMKDCKIKLWLSANPMPLRHAANHGKRKIVRHLLRFNPKRGAVLDVLRDVQSRQRGKNMEVIAILKKYLDQRFPVASYKPTEGIPLSAYLQSDSSSF